MRLDKLLANKAFGSRKEVHQIIKDRRVTINGEITTKKDIHIDIDIDTVAVDGQTVNTTQLYYVKFHKPKGYVTAVEDSTHPVVMDLLPPEYLKMGVVPVGRLDKDTEGLLLLTNDGELAQNLTHPSKGVEKTYEVRIKGRVRDDDLQIIANGVELEDGITAPATIVDLGFDDHNGVHEVEITIHEGRNRQVRRMFEHFGYRIHNLKRIAYAGLTLGGVKRGASRQLTIREVKALKALGTDKA